MTVAPVSSEEVSFLWCLVSWLDLMNSLQLKITSEKCHRILFYGAFCAVKNKSFFLGFIEQIDDVCVLVSFVFPIYEYAIMDCQYSRALSSIHIWKMSWLILSPSGTYKNLCLPRWVLNVVNNDASSVRCILKKALLPSTLEKLVAHVRMCAISSRVGGAL